MNSPADHVYANSCCLMWIWYLLPANVVDVNMKLPPAADYLILKQRLETSNPALHMQCLYVSFRGAEVDFVTCG